MYNLIPVEVLECDDYVCDKKFALLLVEMLTVAEMVPEVAAVKIVQDEVEILAVLESRGHVDQEGVGELREEASFVEH